MLCPNIIPCSIKASFYYLELCWERSLAALEACARTVLHLYSFPHSAPSLALLPLWVGRTRCMFLPLQFPFNFCLHHESQERSAAASPTPQAGPPTPWPGLGGCCASQGPPALVCGCGPSMIVVPICSGRQFSASWKARTLGILPRVFFFKTLLKNWGQM